MTGDMRGRPGLAAYAVGLALFLVAPILIVIPISLTGTRSFAFPPTSWSLQWYERFFSDPRWYESLLHSVEVAALVTAIAVVLGTAAALGLDRGWRRGAPVINALLLSPRVVPVVVLAVGVFSIYLRWQLSGTLAGFAVGHTVLALPVVVIPVAARLKSYDRELERAAASLGASPAATFRLVTLPLIAPGITTGGLFAFITSFDETVISLFLASPIFRTLPVQMYESVTVEIDPTIAAASVVILVMTLVLVLSSLVIQRRR